MVLIKPLSDAGVSDEPQLPSEAALCAVFEELRPRMELFVRKRGLGTASEDVVQETLLAALQSFREGKFDGRSSIQSWIYGILRHKIIDQHRVDARELTHVISLPDETADSGYPARPISTDSHPELTILVDEVLQSLPAKHWLILMLNKRVGLKTREIAPMLRLSPGRTGAILAEAQEMFRRRICGAEEIPLPRRLLK